MRKCDTNSDTKSEFLPFLKAMTGIHHLLH